MNGSRVNEVRIRTPEGVTFAFPLAGPVTRFLAWLIDGVIVTVVSVLLQYVVIFFALVSPDVAGAFFMVAYFILSMGYGIVFEWRWRGQTIGKKALRLRVMDEGGLALTGSQVLLRNLLRAIDSVPACYLVGGIAMLLSARAQRLGDFAAGTVVVRTRKSREPDFGGLFQDRYNSLRELPHLAARLRQQVPPDLAAAAVGALLRRNELEPAARVTLFGELAAAFRQLVPYPPEIITGMPDEAYVRNVVEIVHAGSGARAAGKAM